MKELIQIRDFIFTITLDSITIHHNSKLILSTSKNSPFLACSINHPDFNHGYGTFAITHEYENKTTVWIIKKIDHSEDNILLSGTLSDLKFSTEFELEFCTYEHHLNFRINLPLSTSFDLVNIHIVFQSSYDEAFFGCGEQLTHFNLKTHAIPMMVREDGVGRGMQPFSYFTNRLFGDFASGDQYSAYKPVPFFISSKLYGFLLDSRDYSCFDFTKDNETCIIASTNSVSGSIYNGSNPKDILYQYSNNCGRMAPLPSWTQDGVILGLQGGQDIVRKIFQKTIAAETPVAGLWLQDWCGKRNQVVLGKTLKRLWWNWEPDSELYPEWESFVKEFQKQNVSMLSYVNSFLADVELGGKTNFKHNFYKEALDLGYLVMNSSNDDVLLINSGPSFRAGLVDLFNLKAFNWLKNILVNQFNTGIKGYMADFGEFLPPGSYTCKGIATAADHNHYAEEWSRLQHEVLKAVGSTDKVIFHRSGFINSPSNTSLFWTGDQLVSWDGHDGIKAGLIGLLSSGLCGFSLNHSDVGGYSTFSFPVFGFELGYARSKELLMRWMELSAFSCIFRTHEGSMPQVNSQFYSDSETLHHLAYCGKMFKSLKAYKKILMDEAYEFGYPLVRSMLLEFPHEKESWFLTDQFMFGCSILVRPVLDSNVRGVDAYLPNINEKWIHLWTLKSYSSGWVNVDAEIGHPGVFIRESHLQNPELEDFITWAEEEKTVKPNSWLMCGL